MSLQQWKHTTAAVQKTLAPTRTYWNALLTMSPMSNRLYIFTGHWHTVSRLNYVAFVEKEKTICLIPLVFVAPGEHSFSSFQEENVPWNICVLLTGP